MWYLNIQKMSHICKEKMMKMLTLRMPDELHARLKRIRKEGFKIGGYVVSLIEENLPTKEREIEAMKRLDEHLNNEARRFWQKERQAANAD